MIQTKMKDSCDSRNIALRSKYSHSQNEKKVRPKSLQIESWEVRNREERDLLRSFYGFRNRLHLFDLSPVEKKDPNILRSGPDAGHKLGSQKSQGNKGANLCSSDAIWSKVQYSHSQNTEIDSSISPQSGARPKKTSVHQCKNRQRPLSCSDITGKLQYNVNFKT